MMRFCRFCRRSGDGGERSVQRKVSKVAPSRRPEKGKLRLRMAMVMVCDGLLVLSRSGLMRLLGPASLQSKANSRYLLILGTLFSCKRAPR